MLSDIKSLLRHSSIYGISNLLQKGIGFVMIPVYTHYLTPSDYGILELMDLTINIIAMVMGMRLGSAIVRYYHHYEKPEDKQEVFSTALLFVFVSTVFVVCCLEFFVRPISGLVLGSPDYFRYFQIIFISMGFQTISTVPETWLLTRKKSLAYSLISIGTLVSYLCLNILFIVIYRMGVMGMLLSMIITKFLNTSSLLLLIRKDIGFSFSWEKFFNMLRFGIPLIPESFCMFMIHYSDRFFVQKFCHLDQLGQYSLGYKFG
ncbi:MAG: oligosaccharide flippase family protein [Desulfobacterales bacterium]